MKYLCLCHYEVAVFNQLGPDDFGEIGAACAPHDAALRRSGDVRLIGSLGLPEQSRTLRPSGAAIISSDGPYTSTPEPFGAFFIVEAQSMDEAEETAKLHPGLHLDTRFGRGGIEIRPIETLEFLKE